MKRTQLRRHILFAAIAAAAFVLSSCGSKVQGTYSDPSGAVTLELRSGGQARFTFMGEEDTCTYIVKDMKVDLACKGPAGNVELTIHDDGSLTGPPGTFMPALRKTKS